MGLQFREMTGSEIERKPFIYIFDDYVKSKLRLYESHHGFTPDFLISENFQLFRDFLYDTKETRGVFIGEACFFTIEQSEQTNKALWIPKLRLREIPRPREGGYTLMNKTTIPLDDSPIYQKLLQIPPTPIAQ